jgi:hypothetical protein
MYNFKISYIKGIKNVKVNTLIKKLKYFYNKKHELRVILKQEKDSLIFNI